MPIRVHRGPLHFTLLTLLILTFSVRSFAQETVIFDFDGQDGSTPYGVLISDSAGNLYGTTYKGGVHGAGTIFELINTGNGYKEEVLYNFTGGGDGGFPFAGVVRDASTGALYGTTSCGGSSQCTNGAGGFGTAFLFINATFFALHKFTGGADGGNPVASLTFDGAMNLYGTTEAGGSGTCLGHAGCGVIFRLTAASNYRTEQVLFRFNGGTDGGAPKAPVIFNSAHTFLFGTTYTGGTGTCIVSASVGSTGCGVVYRLSPAGVLTVLHRFTGPGNGSLPVAPVIFDQTGTILYGTASAGGKTVCTGGCGVVFRLSGAALATYHVMHAFAGTDGQDPTGGLALDLSTTYLYGTTFAGGAAHLGTLFEQQQDGVFDVLHSFAGAANADGANPFAGLLVDPLPGMETIPPPTKQACPSKCSGTTSGGGTGSGTAYTDGP